MDTDISGADKGTRKARKHRITAGPLFSVSSVSSVWDKKGHTEDTDGHRLLLEYQGGYGVKLDIPQEKCVFAAIIPQEKCNAPTIYIPPTMR